MGEDPRRQDLAAFNFCGCGWPQHMLVPKGTEAGAPYVLFVMLSNYEFDKVSIDSPIYLYLQVIPSVKLNFSLTDGKS